MRGKGLTPEKLLSPGIYLRTQALSKPGGKPSIWCTVEPLGAYGTFLRDCTGGVSIRPGL